MKKKSLLLRFAVLLAAMMCALGAAAAEAYACYTPSNTTLTFYCDNQRSSRTGTTYDVNLNQGSYSPAWLTNDVVSNVTKAVFDPSFANARPTSTFAWFYNMSKLKSITGLNFLNTSEVTYMELMLNDCSGLTNLDLSSWNTAQVTNMRGMFFGCSNLRTIYVGDEWSTSAVTQSTLMFHDCTSLVGGMGTNYDGSHVDATYAHIDGGTSNPGYFTERKEAYACYTESNTTLTFYCDNQRSSRTGTTYDVNLNQGTSFPAWFTNDVVSNVTKAVFDPSFANARPTSTGAWFYYMSKLKSITGLNFLNTSEVTYMGLMFGNCSNLTNLDLSSWNTAMVTEMSSMFFGCGSLETIYVLEGWTTSAVTKSTYMFYGCTSLVGGQGTTYDGSHVDATYAHIDGGPSNPGYLTEIPEAYACYTESNTTLTFYCDNQRSSRTGTTYDVNLNQGSSFPAWITNDVVKNNVTKAVFDPSFANARPTSTGAWFYNMSKLKSITGLNFLNTSEVTYMGLMFGYCSNLTNLDLSSWNTAKVTEMSLMFYGCGSLKTIYVGNDWSTAAVEESDYMFSSCTSLVGGKGTTYDENHIDGAYAHIDGGPSNPGYFTEWKEAYACYTPSNTTLTFYYDNQRSSRTGTTYDLNTDDNSTGWESDGTNASVTKVVFDSSFAGARPTTTSGWFYGMRKLESMTGMSYLNTSEVTNMSWMFDNCSILTSLDVSQFNTSKVTSMYSMFNSCTGLTSLDLSNFNTSNVTSMGWMFAGCSGLTSIDLSNFNTSNVTSMTWMFNGCSGLTSLDLSSFNTSKVTHMNQMFQFCYKLTSLDLSSFNTAKVTDMGWMFDGCTNLRTIYVGNGWSTAAVTTSARMFWNCTSLVGGKGTTYDENYVDKTYAHIDGGPSNPGYFTDKNAALRGDVNGDGSVNISDVMVLINYLMLQDASGVNMSGADCTQDGDVNISDVTALINYLLNEAWN